MEGTWHRNFFKEPHPTESRSRDLIELCRQHTKPHPVGGRGKPSTVRCPRSQQSGRRRSTVCDPETDRDSTRMEESV